MKPRVAILTLGVADLARSRAFYRTLGWTPLPSKDDIVLFQMNGFVLALFGRDQLAAESGAALGGTSSVLAHAVADKADVDAAFAAARAAGATELKAPHETPWGGWAAYFADPDGHVWEAVWIPDFPMDPESGSVDLSR